MLKFSAIMMSISVVVLFVGLSLMNSIIMIAGSGVAFVGLAAAVIKTIIS